MISRLKGVLLENIPPTLLIDVLGVGYDVMMPVNSAFALPNLGEEVILFTHFVVREDAQQLFGFIDKKEREIFRTLIKVNGVGPKMALAIMSNTQVNDLVRSVRADDAGALEKIPGIGKKTAQRLLIELRDRFKGWEMPQSHSYQMEGMLASDEVTLNNAMLEAESALLSLGYKPQDVGRMIMMASKQAQTKTSEELIRLALKNIK